MIAAQVLLAQGLLGAAGASGAAQVNPILAGGGGIEDIINPVRAQLRAIAKQPKYNGNPRWWAVFGREFSLWVGKNKLRDNEKLEALLECLEGPIRDTWIKSYTDRADSSNPLTYSELFALIQGRGSRLPEDHYRTLLTSFPNIPNLILHEVQNKRILFGNLVNETESAGEHLSDGKLKAIIFAKMPADTAASLRQEQSNEKVKSWWTEVTGFPKGSGRFQVRDALKKCLPTNFSKCKEQEGAWELKFAEKEDRYIFDEVVNRGVSFGGTRLVAKPWIFSFTPTELWEELEKLADANHQQFHEGLRQNPPSKGGNQKNLNNTKSKDCAICFPSVTPTVPRRIPLRITGGIRLMRKEWHKKPARIRPKPLSRRWKKIANQRPAEKVKAVKVSRLLEARETRANPAKDALQKILKVEMVSPILPMVLVEKTIFQGKRPIQWPILETFQGNERW